MLYFLSSWKSGTDYKNIYLMRTLYDGKIVRHNKFEALNYIHKEKPRLAIVRGDGCPNYKIPLACGVPYILIQHDIWTLRLDADPREEQEMIENAAAIVFTSEDHVKYCKRYKLPYYKVIHTRPLEKDLSEPYPKLPGLHLVYAGGILNKNQVGTDFGYRMYLDIFKRFLDNGWKVHIYYPYDYKNIQEYSDIGCIVHGNLPYKQLLKEMSRYTAGFVGYNKIGVPLKAFEYTQTCRPNKLWDYLAAGIPTVGYQVGNGAKIFNNKWGINLKDLTDKTIQSIPNRINKLKITDKLRYSQVMDKDLNKYKAVFREAFKIEPKPIKLPEYMDWEGREIVAKVQNLRPYRIYRAGLVIEPYQVTDFLNLTEQQWKELKAHVGIKIIYEENNGTKIRSNS